MAGAIKILVLGGSGMLGHKLYQTLAAEPESFEPYAAFRRGAGAVTRFGIFEPARCIFQVSASDFDSVTRAVGAVHPAVVVNCVGIVKQDASSKDPIAALTVNSLFPHRLGQLCVAAGARLIHLSTDCVFSGRKGNYVEADPSDAGDLYGRSKLLGEVEGEGRLTLRTSMIGRQLEGEYSLVEWFLGQAQRHASGQIESVKGFKRAIFSGFTTNELSRLIARIITLHPALHGVWQVAAEPISKFDLLSLVGRVYGTNIPIKPEDQFYCDRSLRADRFREASGYVPPAWPEMIERMQQDPTPYAELRSRHGE